MLLAEWSQAVSAVFEKVHNGHFWLEERTAVEERTNIDPSLLVSWPGDRPYNLPAEVGSRKVSENQTKVSAGENKVKVKFFCLFLRKC